MAGFHFNLRSLTRTDASAAAVSLRTLRALHLDEAGDAQEAGRGPGWFESSWELVRGLEVREGLPGDARLNEWLEACVRAEPSPRGDLDLVVAAKVAQLDDLDRFGIAGLDLA